MCVCVVCLGNASGKVGGARGTGLGRQVGFLDVTKKETTGFGLFSPEAAEYRIVKNSSQVRYLRSSCIVYRPPCFGVIHAIDLR